MGILKETGYSYGDLTIIPKCISDVKSRSECNPYYSDNKLPIFTAPMTCVVNEENFNYWDSCGIIPILPRTSLPNWKDKVDFIYTGSWTALGIDEFKKLISSPLDKSLFKEDKIRILLDIANGHMLEIFKLSKEIKSIYGDDGIELMAGNIANPDTYADYCNAGIDYVRCSVGSGLGCLTTSNTGIHYPIASLIEKINEKKAILGVKATTKIIADGGIRNYSDVIKALALGADYVMIGGLFTSLLESAAEFENSGTFIHGIDMPNTGTIEYTFNINGIRILDAYKDDWGDLEVKYKTSERNGYLNLTYIVDIFGPEEIKRRFLKVIERHRDVLKKEFYGMSTKKAQTLMGKKNLKTSEGKEKSVYVTCTVKQWVENMEDYLKSAMSYCNSRTLGEFIGKQNLIPNSIGEINSVNK